MSDRPATSRSARVRRLRRAIAISVVAAAGVSLIASAAGAQVFMNCQPVPLPSAYPSDWSSTQSLCRLLMTNSAGEPVRCDLRVRLDVNGSSATVTVPRQFNVGPTYLTTPEVTNWSGLVFRGSLKEAMDRTGHLPATPIKLTVICENMFGLVTNNPIPTVRDSIIIVPSVPPPPTLLTPADASQISITNPLFSWTSVRLTTGQEVWYQFRLVRVLAGQSSARALEANYPVLETFVHQASLPYPASAPRLEEGALYAWRVQALVNALTDVNDAPAPGNYAHLGLNEGRSPVYSFVWRSLTGDPAAVVGPVGPDAQRAGGLIGLGSDDHPSPQAIPAAPRARIVPRQPTPGDMLALALFTPQRDWWGPTSGGRAVTGRGGVRVTGDASGLLSSGGSDTSATAGASGAATVAATDAAVVGTPSGAPAHTAIEVDTNTPQGEGFATPWLRVSGTSVAAGELYSHTGAGVPSRPDNNGQMMAGVTLSTLNGKLHVPLQVLVSGDQVSFRQSVNQIAVHPEWNWGGLHAGSITPGYSSFSLADATLLGGGADVVRGNWYVGFVDGRVQKAIPANTINAVEAEFQRNVQAGRIGYGKPLGNALEFDVMRARDDAGSLSSADTLVHVAPAGNWVFGARARHTVFDTTTTVQVEGAWSRYERNVNAGVPIVNGGAGGIRIQHQSLLGEVGAALDYVGGGFVTLANSELAPDRVEGRVDARRQLMAGKLRVGGTVGLRRDDLSGTLGGATHRQSYGAQVGWQPAALFGADANVAVLSSRSPGTEQRGALKDLTTTYTLSPHLSWKWLGSTQALTGTLCLQSTEYSDAAAASFPRTRNTTVTAGWQNSVTNNVFVNLSGNYVKSEAGGLTSEVGGVGPGLSMNLFGGRAQSNVQLQLTQTHLHGFGTDRDLVPNLDLRYLVTGHQMLVLRAGARRFRTPAAAAGNFDERLATLQYSAAL